MDDKFSVVYLVEEKAPRIFTVNTSMISADMGEEEILASYDKAVKDHFEKHVFPTAKNRETFLAWAKKHLSG